MSSPRTTALAEFLAAPERPEGTFTYHQLQGFLFSIATAPELIRPSEWLPEVFAGGDAVYADLEEMQLVVGEIMRLYNEVNAAVVGGRDVLPADCEFRQEALANFDADAPVSHWAHGFAAGYDWLHEAWDEFVDDEGELSDELGTLAMVLMFFSSRSLAVAFHQEIESSRSLEEMTTQMKDMLPEAAADFAQLARGISVETERAAHTPRRVVELERNGACPCGSGKKYTKCCGSSASS